MKRRLLSALGASALALSMAGTVAAEDAVYKFPCADITGGGGQLVDEDDPVTPPYDFGFNLTTPERCGGMVYTLYVFDTEEACATAYTSGDTSSALATLVERGAGATSDGTGQVVFEAADLSADTSTWVFGTTSKGKTRFDIAPDAIAPELGEGCLEVGIDPPSGGKWH
jgi:hypothetical protein